MYNTREEVTEAYSKLPNSLRTAIGALNKVSILQDIGKQFNLHVDQIGQLTEVVGATLINLQNPKDFQQNIISNVRVSPEIANQIAARVNNEIFLKIRELEKEEAEKVKREEAGDYSHLDEGEDGEELGARDQGLGVRDTLEPKTQPLKPSLNIFEEKMGKMFDLKGEEDESIVDPYREPIN